MLKEYILNICYYVIITSIIFNVFPNDNHTKYIRLISGFILMMIIISPIVKNFDKGVEFSEIAGEYAMDIGRDELINDIEEYESMLGKRIKEMESKDDDN